MVVGESKERQAIWGIREKHELLFYTVLLIFGGWNIARLDWEDWDSFVLAAGERILASVLIVWFAYQAVHWIVSVIMSAGDYFLRLIEKRKEEDRKRKEEDAIRIQNLQEQVRREAQEIMRKQFEKEVLQLLQKKNASHEVIQQVQYISDSLKPPSHP